MIRAAGIDLGSNTFILTIAELDEHGKIISVLADEIRFVRLGQGVDATQRLHPEALIRAEKALAEFRQILNHYQIEKIFTTATSAARDASNGDELIQIGARFNLPIHIITGLEEARLTYLGAFALARPELYNWVIDIGGGSTEIIFGRCQDIQWRHSFDLGCVRLTEKYQLTIPCPSSQWVNLYTEMQAKIRDQIPQDFRNANGLILGVAGTAVEIERILQQNHFDNSLSALDLLISKLSLYTVQQMIDEFGTQPKRADVLFSGLLVFAAFMKAINAHTFKVTRTGIRYGNLLQAAK